MEITLSLWIIGGLLAVASLLLIYVAALSARLAICKGLLRSVTQSEASCREAVASLESRESVAKAALEGANLELTILRLQVSGDRAGIEKLAVNFRNDLAVIDLLRQSLLRQKSRLEFTSEEGHWHEESVFVRPGHICTGQAANGSCYAGCRNGENCADAVWELQRTWVVDRPVRAIIRAAGDNE